MWFSITTPIGGTQGEAELALHELAIEATYEGDVVSRPSRACGGARTFGVGGSDRAGCRRQPSTARRVAETRAPKRAQESLPVSFGHRACRPASCDTRRGLQAPFRDPAVPQAGRTATPTTRPR